MYEKKEQSEKVRKLFGKNNVTFIKSIRYITCDHTNFIYLMKPDFQTLVDKYINLVYYFARRWVYEPQDLHDIVHETYLNAFKTYEKFSYQSEPQLKSWLLTICRNVILDNRKAKKPLYMEETMLMSVVTDDEGEKLLEMEIEREEIQQVLNAVNKLPQEDQELVKLRIYDELDFKSLSVVFNSSEAAVKMKFYRIILKLKEELV